MDIERSLISSVCGYTGRDLFEHGVKPEMFSSWRREFEWIMKFFREHGAFPSRAAFKRQYPSFVFVKTQNPCGYYCDELRNRVLFDSMCELTERMRDTLEGKARDDPVIAWDTLTQGIASIASTARSGSDTDSDSDGPSRWKDYIDRKRKKGMLGYAMGWPAMDDALAGIQNGHLLAFAGRPRMGKTWLLCHLVKTIWREQKGRPLFISYEMPVSEIMRRVDALVLRLSYNALKKGLLSPWQEKLYHEWLTKPKKRPFVVCSPMNVSALMSKVKELSPTVLFLDGAHAMVDDIRARSTMEQMTMIVRQLKRMAVSENIPIIASTHLNREAGKSGSTGELENVSWTDAWGKEADDVIKVYGDPESKSRTLNIMKQREGGGGEAMIRFDLDKMDLSQYGSTDVEVDVGVE